MTLVLVEGFPGSGKSTVVSQFELPLPSES